MQKKYARQILTLFILTLLFNTNINAQLNLPRSSQKATVTQKVGISDISVTYSRPAVKGREIWGKLVPYGMKNLGFGTAKTSPWRVGANENTIITFGADAKVQGQDIKAGTYGLFMVIHQNDDVDILFSSDTNAWGSFFYNPANDVLKVSTKMKETTHREFLTFEFVDVQANETTLSLIWGKKEIPFKIEMNVTKIVIDNIKSDFNSKAGFDRLNWEKAANFANNNGDTKQALQWINVARNGQFFSKKTFVNAQIKANILTKMKKQDDAFKLMTDALELGTTFEIHNYGQRLVKLGFNDEALKVFQFNAEKNKNTWPVNFGLGGAYAAKGNNKLAIKYLTKSLSFAPTKENKTFIQEQIDKLKKSKKK